MKKTYVCSFFQSPLGSRDGVLVRIPAASRQCGHVSILAWCHACMWAGLSLLLVLAMLQGFFCKYSSFSASTKPTFPNSSSIRIENPLENQLRLMQCFLSKYCLCLSVQPVKAITVKGKKISLLLFGLDSYYFIELVVVKEGLKYFSATGRGR